MSVTVLGVDTNVLVRFLAADDEEQELQAKRVISNPSNHPIYLSLLVLSETYTVLTKVRKFPRAAVDDSYRLLLRSPGFRVEDPDMAGRAIEDGASAGCGFVDALIALQNLAAGCRDTVTFDRDASRLTGMSRIGDQH